MAILPLSLCSAASLGVVLLFPLSLMYLYRVSISRCVNFKVKSANSIVTRIGSVFAIYIRFSPSCQVQ